MAYKTIIAERIGDIAKIIFNRPEVLNAYNKTVSAELITALDQFSGDDTRVIVLTGSGKAFMAGADINMINEWALLRDDEMIRDDLDRMFKPSLLEACPKPVIAAVNGFAFGMGCEIALGCDFRIAAKSARFGQPEVKIGVIPGAGGSQRLCQLVGAAKALEMICIGDPIDAEEAYRIGMVNRVVAVGELWAEVEAFAGKLVEKSALGLNICKKLIYHGGTLPLEAGLSYELEQFSKVLLSEDAQEGTRAFLEKRPPVFKGR